MISLQDIKNLGSELAHRCACEVIENEGAFFKKEPDQRNWYDLVAVVREVFPPVQEMNDVEKAVVYLDSLGLLARVANWPSQVRVLELPR